jgi:GH24 family phage-related lysozyme (muramidase)
MKAYKELYDLGFFKWLNSHNKTSFNGLVFRWLREKHGCSYSIGRHNHGVVHIPIGETVTTFVLQDNKSYEEAEQACIKKLIEIIKSKS